MKPRTVLAIAAAAAAVAAVLVLTGSHVLAHRPTPPVDGTGRQIEVDGTARLDVPADRVDLTVTLEVTKPAPLAATRALRPRRDELVRRLKRLDVGRKDLVLSCVHLYPIPRNGGGISGYRAGVTLVATLRDLGRIGRVMEGAAAVGASRIQTRFWSSKLVAMKRRVRDMALAAARDKARQIARRTGVRLGRVRRVSETHGGSWQGRRWGAGVHNMYAAVQRSGRERAAAPDAVRLNLRLRVVFDFDGGGNKWPL